MMVFLRISLNFTKNQTDRRADGQLEKHSASGYGCRWRGDEKPTLCSLEKAPRPHKQTRVEQAGMRSRRRRADGSTLIRKMQGDLVPLCNAAFFFMIQTT